jgi:hypothetical protein
LQVHQVENDDSDLRKYLAYFLSAVGLEGWGSTIELHPQMKIRCVNQRYRA